MPCLGRFPLLCCAVLAGAAAAAEVGAGSNAPDRDRVQRGRLLFEQRWTVAPSSLGRWGRGPTSNAEACTDCHVDLGRGAPPEALDEPMTRMVLRLSTRARNADGAPQPHPVYGLQLQVQGTLGVVPPEGSATIDWIEVPVALEDGAIVRLRRPQVRITALAFGALETDTRLSARMAPALAGVGLLEAIPDAALAALAARDAGDGIRGRVHRLRGGTIIGRFGHKATAPSLHEQILTALHEDLGLTSTTFPRQNCPLAQTACGQQPVPLQPEVSDDDVNDLVALMRALPPPTRRAVDGPDERRGEALFLALNCGGCHVPRITPEAPEAYTDLLLHDLGNGLADGRPEFGAGGGDWRTSPLWGIGAAAASGARFLHDGRARTLEEAILWHGGEAEAARLRYTRLPQSDREALIRFLSTL